MARRRYPFVPRAVVPDAYPSLRRVRDLSAPLLVIHGDRDEIVPLAHAEALFEAASDPKRLQIIEGVGHDDLVAVAGDQWATAITRFNAAGA
jgi:fermentation-respiration switch protein FrsA (DUF1100 family)